MLRKPEQVVINDFNNYFSVLWFWLTQKKNLKNLIDAPLKLINQLTNQSSKAILKQKKKDV